jgi:hypothetical protein
MFQERFRGRVSDKTRYDSGRSECDIILYDFEPFAGIGNWRPAQSPEPLSTQNGRQAAGVR